VVLAPQVGAVVEEALVLVRDRVEDVIAHAPDLVGRIRRCVRSTYEEQEKGERTGER
jgi:hypothetical protein